MKFIHLADLHLGKIVNEFSMTDDQRFILQEIKDIIKDKSVDAVIIAGDVYDRSVPGEEAVSLFSTFITDLSKVGKSVFVISGNHDSEVRLDFGSELLSKNNVYIAGVYNGEIRKVTLKDEYGALNVWLMPYIRASYVRHFYPEADTGTYDAAIRTALGKCEVDGSQRNILVAHQFAVGRNGAPALSGSENASVNVGTIESVGADCFDAFDYTALGHIHSAQEIGRGTCRYAGSPLKYSLAQREIDQEKSVPVFTMKEKGNVEVELVPLHPKRNVRRIKGTLDMLLKNAVENEDYIYATLTDETAQYDAMNRLREVYPNVMKLDYDNEATQRLSGQEDEQEEKEKSFHELICEFYLLMNGREPNELEWKLIAEAAKEAEVIE